MADFDDEETRCARGSFYPRSKISGLNPRRVIQPRHRGVSRHRHQPGPPAPPTAGSVCTQCARGSFECVLRTGSGKTARHIRSCTLHHVNSGSRASSDVIYGRTAGRATSATQQAQARAGEHAPGVRKRGEAHSQRLTRTARINEYRGWPGQPGTACRCQPGRARHATRRPRDG